MSRTLALALLVFGCASGTETSRADRLQNDAVGAAVGAVATHPFGIPGERVVRIQGSFQSNIEYSAFEPCSESGGTWWLEAPDDFWARVYAFSPADYIEQWDPSEVVEIDVTANVKVVDDPTWVRSVTDFRGFGHGLAYPGRIIVLETHAVQLRDEPGANRPSLCP